MPLAQKSRRPNVVEVIFGINLNTFEVERITVGRDGTLAKRERDGSTSIHKLPSDTSLEVEVRSFYNLTNLLFRPPGTNFETDPEVLRLTGKAEDLKRARQAR